MKRAEDRRHYGTLAIGAAVVIVAATGGYLKGNSDGSQDARTRNASRDQPHPLDNPDEKGKPAGSTASLEKTRKRLWTIWNSSPNPSFDPEAQAALERLLVSLSSAELGELIRTIPPGAQYGADWQMRRVILDVWVLKDGPAAMAFLAGDTTIRPDRRNHENASLAMTWAEEQPDTAFAWMNDPDLPPALKERAANLRLNSLMVLMDTNPDRAFAELSRMSAEDVSRQLLLWAGTHGKDPAVRARLLEHAAASGDPAELRKIQSTILKVLAMKDPQAAADFRATLDSDGSGARELDVALTLGCAEKAPEEAFGNWLEKNDVSKGIPQEITFGIGAWMWRDADKAITWLHEQPPGEKRDALYLDSIPALVGFDKFDKAADIAAAIESPEMRAAAFHALDLRWSLVNQEAADRWKKELSAENRKLVAP